MINLKVTNPTLNVKDLPQATQCPFTDADIKCRKEVCDCGIRVRAQTIANQDIAENMTDYWRHLNSGAE